MPTLHWVGKEKVVNHHHDVPFRLLDKKYTFTPNEGTPTNSTGNKIIHGDNLEALKSLLPEFEGKINCIYIDPPYNTGNEGWVYNDNVNDPKIKKWLGEVVGKEGEDLSRHDKWLCMMYPRLKLLHRLLADDGVIFISIDDNEQANSKLVMDEIFGENNFIGNICWESKTKSQNTLSSFNKLQPKIEYIILYKKKSKNRFALVSNGQKSYSESDDSGVFRCAQIEVMSSEGMRGRESMIFPILNIVPPTGKQWKIGIETVNKFLLRNDVFIKNNKPYVKYRPDDERGDKTVPFWGFFPKEVGTAESGKKELNEIFASSLHGFETVKPIDVVKQLVFHASKPDDIILDSFAGSATTAHAVLKLNAQDGGNRRFILCEMMDYADILTAERVRRVANGYGEGTKAMPGTGGSFDYYEVGPTLFTEDKNLNEQVGIDAIRNYVTYTESIPQAKQCAKDNLVSPHAIGASDTTLWLFYYERTRVTTLDLDFLASLNINAHIQSGNKRPEQYIIYADKCALDQDFLTSHSIIFKRIPRDITRF